jgi:hypothetical protein
LPVDRLRRPNPTVTVLSVVTANLRHFRRVPELGINAILYESKQRK